MSRKYFGTDGIRGFANDFPMTSEFFVKLGQALGIYFSKNHPNTKIVLGKDTRRSGYMLELALSSGLCSVGVDTYLTGPLPTPGIAYLTKGLRAAAGVMLSASHNPYFDNGIKVFDSAGLKLTDEAEQEIEALLEQDLTPYLVKYGEIGRVRAISDAIGQYAVFLKEQFPKHLSLDGIRIVVDPAHGAAYKVAPKVFEELGAEIIMINNHPSGTNINDQCGALHPEALRKEVLKYRADLGVALDGDADRLVVVDGAGNVLDGDTLLAICALDLKEKNKLVNNTLVTTTMSSLGLELTLNNNGCKLVRTDVGDRYVLSEMQNSGFNLGGESSGHIIYRDLSTSGDGLLAALKLLEIVVEKKVSVNSLAKIMIHTPQVLENVKVSEKKPLDQLPKTKALIEDWETKLGTSGRVLFRYSGTEKLARIMIEGRNEIEIKQAALEIAEQFKKEI